MDIIKDKQSEVEASFHSSIQDVMVIAQKLLPHCRTVEELIGMVGLALENEGQLRLLMSVVSQKK